MFCRQVSSGAAERVAHLCHLPSSGSRVRPLEADNMAHPVSPCLTPPPLPHTLTPQVRFVVMSNIFPMDLLIHRRYDIKGSTEGRTVGNAAKVWTEGRSTGEGVEALGFCFV